MSLSSPELLTIFRNSVFSGYENLAIPTAQKRYNSPICPEASSGWIFTKFGLGGPLADIINCVEFCGSRLMGFDSVRGPIDLAGRR